MTRSEQAAVLAARFEDFAHSQERALNAQVYGAESYAVNDGAPSIRDMQADALAELAELVSWVVDQLESVR